MKIIIATGGSGGHIFPALYVARELKNAGHEIKFAGTFGDMVENVKKEGYDIFTTQAQGLSFRDVLSFFASLISMTKAFFQSLKLLNSFHPDVVAGFGGYGAFPVVFAATLSRYPTLIHEQNVVPGRANRILSKLVNRIAISFEQSKKYFGKKAILTGCPCHHRGESFSKEEIIKKFNLQSQRFTILIFGGSQGSHRINENFLKAAALLKNEFSFQVIHVTGKKDYDVIKKAYESLGIKHSLFPFLNEIEQAYQISDLVISRSGAVTVCEIASFQMPAILIPYPFAGGHQKNNAAILAEAGMAEILEEKDLSAETLKSLILTIVKDRRFKDKLQEGGKNIYISDAATRIAREVVALRHEN